MVGGVIVQVVPRKPSGCYVEVLDEVYMNRQWRGCPDLHASHVNVHDLIWWQSRTAYLNDQDVGECYPAENPLKEPE